MHFFPLFVSTQFNSGLWCLLSPSHTSSSSNSACRDKPKKKQGTISPTTVRHKAHCVMSGSVTHFYLFFSWVEKFSSLALTISIVTAASAHMHSIHNSTGCNKFAHVLQGAVKRNSGKYGRWLLDVGRLVAKWLQRKVCHQNADALFCFRHQTCRW